MKNGSQWQRKREIGIRLALGASRRDVRSLVMAASLRLILVGIGIGLLFSYLVARLLASQVWGVSWYDPLTLAGVVLLLTTVGMAASLIPSLRRSTSRSSHALRCDD